MTTMDKDIIFDLIDGWIKKHPTITPNSYNELQKHVRNLYNNNSLSFDQIQEQQKELTIFFEKNKGIISQKLCNIRLNQIQISKKK